MGKGVTMSALETYFLSLRKELERRRFSIDLTEDLPETFAAFNDSFRDNPISIWVTLDHGEGVVIKICEVNNSLSRKAFNAIMCRYMEHFDAIPESGVTTTLHAAAGTIYDIDEVAELLTRAYGWAVTAD